MSEIKVTIAIPAYNAEKFLRETIQSCIAQDYKNLDIVVINDGSTDGTLSVAEEFKANNKLNIIDQKNKGKAESLNQVMEDVDSDYLAIMDADDVAMSSRISRQVAFMEQHPRLGATSSYLEYISESGRAVGVMKSDLLSAEAATRYEDDNEPFALFCPSAMIRKEVFKNKRLRFRGEFWPADDVDLWNRIYEAGYEVFIQPEILVKYRIHSLSAVTSSFMRTRKQFEYLRECMRARRAGLPEPTRDAHEEGLAKLPLWKKFNRYRKNIAKASYRTAGFAFAEKSYLRAMYYMAKSLICQPSYTLRRLRSQLR